MFESYTEVNKVNKRKKWTTLAAVCGELALVAGLASIPLLFPPPIQVAEVETPLIAPPPPLPPPPSGNRAAAPKTPVRQFDPSKIQVPQNIPQQPVPIPAPMTDNPPSISAGVAGGVQGGVTGGQLGGVLGGIIGAAPSVAPPPPPPPPPPASAPVTPSEIKIGGNVEAARLISSPAPDYPYAAKLANVHGDVTLNAVIGPDGKIENLSIVSGPPLLVTSAMDAVKQWVYAPTVLNGKAVKVDTQIIVHFQMG